MGTELLSGLFKLSNSTQYLLVSVMIIASMRVLEVNGMYILPEQNDTEPVHLLAPRMRYFDPPAAPGYWDSIDISGRWIYLSEKSKDLNLTGAVLCYSMKSGESQEDAARYFSGTGIIALFTLFRTESDYPGAGNWVRDGTKPTQPFPLYEITLKQNKSMDGWYSNQTQIIVRLTHDPNPWDKTFAIALPIVGIAILVFSGVICIMAACKLTIIILKHGFQVSMAQTVLWINILGCILRIIFGAADPFGSFDTTRFLFSQIFLTISYPSTVAGALLISLYWHEMIHRKTGNRVHAFLDRLKWPFLAITAFMYAFELTTATIRGLLYSFSIILYLDGAMYFVFSFAVFVFFIVTRYRLQKVFDKINSGLKSRRGQKLSLATFQLQAIIILMVVFLILLVLIGVTGLVWTPVSFPIMWGCIFFVINLVSLFQVLLITAPRISWRFFICGLCDPEARQLPFFESEGSFSAGSTASAYKSNSSFQAASYSQEMSSAATASQV
jgi:hypothetical protein